MFDALRYLSIGLPVVLLLRLWQKGLWKVRPYSGLAVFLVIQISRDLVLLKPQYSTHLFTLVWEATLPILIVGQIIAGLATYRALADLYPKIGRFAVCLFGGCLLAACLVGLGILPLEMRRIGTNEANLRVLFLVQRWIASILAGGLILAVLFLAQYRRPLKKLPANVVLHTVCIAIYFASYACLYVLENLNALGHAAVAEQVQLLLVDVVYAAWTLRLSRQGQVGEPWPPLDPEVRKMINARYESAIKRLRQAAERKGRE